ncbi:helix-turn-helix transcriptional regulator [Methylophilus sp. VKM B-3414]|uniref:helix-turn-helix domain-containing protein n=1 Tax=Methylophilus sp. VKM B-3414 TaxID=3076121 RepID=UPI0028C6A3D4|nr:helix-turn-helix transcriptional regulator [Methylophilus sp. VKM B-3414]MDT7849937.1 helix-turn-helix transcriptional regulator [Methylophilus sp. VKM B-3414]
MKFNERLKWARENAGFTQQELVDLLPTDENGKPMMSQANLAKMEKNENTVGSNFSYFIAKVCNVSPEWLIFEIGKPEIDVYSVSVNDPEYKVLQVMQQMQPYMKSQAARLLDSLAEPTQEPNGKHNSK